MPKPPVVNVDPSIIGRLRRMIQENEGGVYTDAVLSDVLLATQNEDGLLDLHAAACAVWEDKSALTAEHYSFSADGASYSREQWHDHCMGLARYHGSRRLWGNVPVIPADLFSLIVKES